MGALLKVINPYVSSLPILLSPLWKGICTLLSLIHHGHSSYTYLLPQQVADETLVALGRYLYEGTMQMMQAMQHYIQRKSIVQQQYAHLLKIVTFLVARCTTVLSTTTTTTSFTNEETTNASSPAITHLLALLVQLRGLTCATRAFLNKTTSCLTPQDEAFLSQAMSLQHKVEQCLLDSVCTNNDHTPTTTTTTTTTSMESPRLATLVATQTICPK